MPKILPLMRSAQDRPGRIRPLVATLALVCTAVGAVVVIGFTTLALVPLLLSVAVVGAWLLALLLFGWAGIEGLAALERWFESDSRFQR
ncbi:MAG: glypican [Synechococcaceae cyanobacterium ELA263]